MDINKIEMLLRALELGSMSKAAAEYNYTPSAFSHMAKTLEEEIGTRIIRRTHNGVEAENEEILTKLKEICRLNREIHGIVGEKEEMLTIGTYSSLAKYLLPKITKRFAEENPGTRVNIVVGNNMKELMTRDAADIYFGEALPGDDLVVTSIGKDPYVAVFPIAANVERFLPDECYGTFIAPNDERVRRYVNSKNYDSSIEVNSDDDALIVQMVAAGGGFSVLSELSVSEYGDKVKMVPLDEDFNRNLCFVYKKKRKNKNVKKFTECISD